MDKKDLNKLVMLGFIIAFLTCTFVFFRYSSLIPMGFIVPILLLVQYLYAVPWFTNYYYKLYNQKANLFRFVPVINEALIFSKKYAIAYVISFILFLLAFAGCYFPIGAALADIAPKLALNSTVICIRSAIVLFVVVNIVTGLAYNAVYNNIKAVHQKFLKSTNTSSVDAIHRVLVFIPSVRLASILYMGNLAYKMNNLHSFAVNSETQSTLKEVK